MIPQKTVETLTTPFDKADVRKHPESGWDYVSGPLVIRRLNRAFDYDWSFDLTKVEILPTPERPMMILAYGKLSAFVEGHIIEKSDVGHKDVKYPGYDRIKDENIGEDVKAAATDCLKRCARYFGVAQELYGDEEQLIARNRKNVTGNASARTGGTSSAPQQVAPQQVVPPPAQQQPQQTFGSTKPIQSGQAHAIRTSLKMMGMTEADLPSLNLGVEKIEGMAYEQACKVINALENRRLNAQKTA